MRYESNGKNNMIWTPLRIRDDKTEPQYFVVANNVWSTIHNPITEYNITTGLDIPDIKEEEEIYFAGNKSDVKYDTYTKNMRNFHNLYLFGLGIFTTKATTW